MSRLTDPWSSTPSSIPAYTPDVSNLYQDPNMGSMTLADEPDPLTSAPSTAAGASMGVPGEHQDHAVDDDEGPMAASQWNVGSTSAEEHLDEQEQLSANQLEGKAKRVLISLQDGLSGKYLGKYHTYSVTVDGLSSIRRFSDFVALHTYLSAVYVFRLLPPLPGKRLSLSGHYSMADAQFLQRRAKGLSRYSDALLCHPAISKDPLVYAFFHDPQPPSAELYKLSASTEEALRPDNKPSSAVPANLDDLLDRLKRGQLQDMLSAWTSFYHALDRAAKCEAAQASEHAKASHELIKAHHLDSHALLPGGERGKLQNDMQVTSDVLHKRTTLSHLLQSDVLGERLKAHVELYQSMGDLLQRHQKLAADGVDDLRRKINTSQSKIEKYRQEQKPPTWESSVQKLEESISSDNQRIEALLSRRTFIRHAMHQEVTHFSQQTTRVSVTLAKLASAQREYSEAMTDSVWSHLCNALEY